MAKDKATAVQVDFTNVKEGGSAFNKRHQEPGDYAAKVTKVQDAKSKKTDAKMWLFTIEVNGATYPYYCTFAENQLWKIRNLFVAAGINVPKKRMSVDPNKVVGKKIAVTLEDEEYDGKMQSVVQATFPVSELGESAGSDDDDDDDNEEEEEATPTPAPSKGKKDKAGKKGKKAKKNKELEELDTDDI